MAKRLLLAFAMALALGAGVLYWAGSHLTRPAYSSAGEPDPELFATPVLIPNQKGYVAGWVARGAGSGAILLLHGVRADRRQMQARALFLNRLGYTVLLIDLPAHGESLGEAITFGAREADGVRVALAWLARNLPGEKIGVIGTSLGAASLVLAKPGKQIDALVIEAMYPTIDEATANRLALHGGAPARILAPLLLMQLPWRIGVTPDQLRPIDAMQSLACPVLVIGGAQDRHTPQEETRRIFAAAKEPKQLWLVDGAAHVDLHEAARTEYEQRVGAFLSAHLR
ncbi:MAG: alpha/beta fold hydrolase [Pseudomonadota bacterium]